MDILPNEVLLQIFSYLKWKDLLQCRNLSARFNLLSCEILHKEIPPVTLTSRMEVVYFLHLAKTATFTAAFSKIRLAINTIPVQQLDRFASIFKEQNIELTIFRKHEEDFSKMGTRPQDFLEKLTGITYLEIEAKTELKTDFDISDAIPKFAIFPNLGKIVWRDPYMELLVGILKAAPALQTIEVYCWSRNRARVSLQDVPLVITHLPPRAILNTTIPIYFNADPEEINHFLKMCMLRNRISMLTLSPVPDFHEGGVTTIWNSSITKFLESQSESLKVLKICCKKYFEIPAISGLEYLKIKDGCIPLEELIPNKFPALRKLVIMDNFSTWENVPENIIPQVSVLDRLWDEDAPLYLSKEFLRTIGTNFPNLRQLRIHIQQFPQLLKFSQRNSAPSEELCVYTAINYRKSAAEEIEEVIAAVFSSRQSKFATTKDQFKGSTLGLLKLKKLKFLDIDTKIFKFLLPASRRGIIKLDLLDLKLRNDENEDFEKYKVELCKYHDIVTLKNSQGIEESEDEEPPNYIMLSAGFRGAF